MLCKETSYLAQKDRVMLMLEYLSAYTSSELTHRRL